MLKKASIDVELLAIGQFFDGLGSCVKGLWLRTRGSATKPPPFAPANNAEWLHEQRSMAALSEAKRKGFESIVPDHRR